MFQINQELPTSMHNKVKDILRSKSIDSTIYLYLSKIRQFYKFCQMNNDLIKAHIINSSKNVFKERGFSQITMSDIANASNKGRSTIYYYFKNKEEVFEEVALLEYLTIIQPAKTKIAPSRSIEENLTGYVAGKLNSLFKKIEGYRFLVEDIKQNPHLNNLIYFKIRHLENEIFTNILTWALENDEIAAISDDDIKFLAMAMGTALNSLEKEMLLYGTVDNMDIRLQWLVSLLIKGLKYDQ